MDNQDRLINAFSEINLKNYRLPMICIYQNPNDYKGMYIARVFDVDKPTNYILMRTSSEAIRNEIPNGFTLVPRLPADDPKIVETWI